MLSSSYEILKSKCPYASDCHYAHGQYELLEWQRFSQQQEQQVTLGHSWRQKVCSELINKLKRRVPSNDVVSWAESLRIRVICSCICAWNVCLKVTEQRDGVEISSLLSFIDESESQPYASQFDIQIRNEMVRVFLTRSYHRHCLTSLCFLQHCRFKKVALLRGDSTFRFVAPQNPCLSVSHDGTELSSTNPSSETQLLTASVKFESNRAGSFPCDVIFDLGAFPYLIQTLRVEIADSKNLEALKKLQRSTRLQDGHWDVAERDVVYSNIRQSAGGTNYDIPDSASLGADINRLGIVGGGAELTKDSYKPLFHALLFLEELHHRAFLREFSARNVPIVTDKDGQIAGLWTATLRRIVPPRIAQTALIRPCDSKKTYSVPVVSVHEDCVEVDVAANVDLANSVRKDLQLTVDFQFRHDSTHFSQLHRSIDRLPETAIVTHLLGAAERESRTSRQVPDVSSKSLDAELSSNPKQKKAVNLILSHSSPVPIIINGPFGTGKTRLLTEAIRLLTLRRKDRKVLVCTQSNHAADLYVTSFDQFIQKKTIRARVMRICYSFRKVGTVPVVVRNYCDHVEAAGQFVMPSYGEFDDSTEAVVVVTTLITSGQLLQVGLRPGFFTHIIIDEAAQATEPESVTALALAGPRTVVVLAGDCRQVIVIHCTPKRSL